MSRAAAAALVPLGFALASSGGANPALGPAVVEVRQARFQPDTLTVVVGDTVVWVNRDIVPHTATALDGHWNSGELPNQASWQLVAEEPGTTEYYCEYHPTMRGVVVIEGG